MVIDLASQESFVASQINSASSEAEAVSLMNAVSALSEYTLLDEGFSLLNRYEVTATGQHQVVASAGNGPALLLESSWFVLSLSEPRILEISAEITRTGLQSGLDATRQAGVFSYALYKEGTLFGETLLSFSSVQDASNASSNFLTLSAGTYYFGARAFFQFDPALDGVLAGFASTGSLALKVDFLPVPEVSVSKELVVAAILLFLAGSRRKFLHFAC